MHTLIVYTASPCPVNPPVPQQVRQGAQQGVRQSRQRTTCIMRTGNARQRISGEFFEVMAHILTNMPSKKGATC